MKGPRKTRSRAQATRKPPAPKTSAGSLRFSSAEVSALLGITDRHHRNLVRAQILPGKGQDGRFPGPETVSAWTTYQAADAEGDETISTAKARFWSARATREELETAKLKTELLPRADVEALWTEAMTIYSGELDAAAARTCAEFAGLADAAVIRQRFLEEERAARASANDRIAATFSRRRPDTGSEASPAEDDGGVGGDEPSAPAG